MGGANQNVYELWPKDSINERLPRAKNGPSEYGSDTVATDRGS